MRQTIAQNSLVYKMNIWTQIVFLVVIIEVKILQ